jgi:4-amino-4-deoxy-L-arabinose transferase-like glycosyltransferase
VHEPASRAGSRPATATRSTTPDPVLTRTILAATLVAAVLRFFRLGHQSLWIDEQFTLTAAGLPGRLAWRDLLDNVHGPLHTLSVALAATLGGDSEWVLRLPSALAGIALVPAMAWLARVWLGRDTVAPAVWLTAGSPFLVWYSQECRNYAFLLLGATLATAALFELGQRFDRRGVLRYLVAAVAALLSNLSFALLLPLHAWRWFAPGPARRARLVSSAVVAAGLLLALLPWLSALGGIWDWSRLAPGRDPAAGEAALRGETTFHPAAVPFALHAMLMGYSGGPSLRGLRADPGGALRAHLPEVLAAAALFGWLLALGLRTLARRGRLADTLLWLVAPALLVSYFAANNFKVFNPRYLAVSLPCVLLVLAAAFAGLGPRARRAAAAAVAVLWALSLGRMAFDPVYGREDYRAALARVRAGFVPGERVLAVGAPEPVEWYGRGLPVSRWWLGFAAVPERMASRLEDSLAVAPGTWIVCSRPEDDDPEGRFARWLDERVAPGDRWSASGVKVWHWRRDAAPRGERP